MTGDAPLTVLVTGSGGPLGVNVTRSLQEADRGFRLIGTDANRWHLPLSLCDETYLIPFARDHDGYRSALTHILKQENVDVVLPTHPVEVRAVAQLRDADALGRARTALPQTSVLEVADDKARTQARLASVGIAVPRTRVLEAARDVDRAFEQYGNPVWVRGSGAPGLGIGGAALPCREPGVACAWIEHHNGWGKMAASEYLPGRNLTWMGAFAGGELLACGGRERLEYVLPHVSPSGITGAPAVSRTVDPGPLGSIGEAAVRAIDDAAHGVYFVDFKGDRDDEPRVTEINAGRCGTTVHFYTRAGFNFPALLVDIAMGTHAALPDPARAVETDLYWVRTLDCGPALVRGDAGFDGYPSAGLGAGGDD